MRQPWALLSIGPTAPILNITSAKNHSESKKNEKHSVREISLQQHSVCRGQTSAYFKHGQLRTKALETMIQVTGRYHNNLYWAVPTKRQLQNANEGHKSRVSGRALNPVPPTDAIIKNLLMILKINGIIIVWPDFLSPPRGSSHVMSDYVRTHTIVTPQPIVTWGASVLCKLLVPFDSLYQPP